MTLEEDHDFEIWKQKVIVEVEHKGEEWLIEILSPRDLYVYSCCVKKERCPALEAAIWKDFMVRYAYASWVSRSSDDKTKIKWMETEGMTYVLQSILICGAGKEAQEWVCQNRPDLIGLFKDLDPSLRSKYSHELEIAGVDL